MKLKVVAFAIAGYLGAVGVVRLYQSNATNSPFADQIAQALPSVFTQTSDPGGTMNLVAGAAIAAAAYYFL